MVTTDYQYSILKLRYPLLIRGDCSALPSATAAAYGSCRVCRRRDSSTVKSGSDSEVCRAVADVTPPPVPVKLGDTDVTGDIAP